MKVLLLSRYSRLGASSRLRYYQYLPHLKKQGINVEIASLFEDNYISHLNAGKSPEPASILRSYMRRLGFLLKSGRFDLLWIEYEILPWLPAWGERVLAHLKIPYIVDFDDAIFHRYNMHPSRFVRSVLGKKIDTVMQKASLVIVGNTYLRNRAIRTGAKWVEYLPTVIDLNRYKSKPFQKKSIFTIGWIGSPTTAPYLHIVEPALAEMSTDATVRLLLIGSGQIRLRRVPTEIRPWSEETEVNDIQDFDVGIMPIPDDAWTRGKCGYKLIQYMACSRPVVASRVGVNTNIVENGANGYLATTTKDWVHALNELRESYTTRERMGRCGRKKVEAHYHVQITAPRLVSYFNNVFHFRQ